MQEFYKGKSKKSNRPRLLQTAVLTLSDPREAKTTMFALALMIEGGSLLILDPMSLQPFKAFQLSPYHQVDSFLFH